MGDQARAELVNLIDLQMSPLGLAAMNALAPARGETILDIGCGAGETLLQLADQVGRTGQIIGVDIGPRVLAIARARAAHVQNVTLLQQDASRLTLPDRCLDGIFSRFGTMFFKEQATAFANMHRMLKEGGRIGFVCWRAMSQNELDFVPVDAARLSATIDITPLGLEDPETIHGILHATGFAHIKVEPYDARVSSGGVDATLDVVTRVGALGKVLRESPALFPQVVAHVRNALSARERDGKVYLGAATWIVTAISA